MALGDVRDKLLPVYAKLRGIANTKFGLRQYRVFLRRVRTSDARGGRGSTPSITDVELTERPRIRQATTDDVVRSGGMVQLADFLADRVTPQNAAATVGVTFETIYRMPTTSDEQVYVVLVGPGMPAYAAGPPPNGGKEFTIATGNPTGNFGYSFVLRPRTA